jgi:hypothetical protein
VCNYPLKYAWRGLEEVNKEIILLSISTPTLGGPINRAANIITNKKKHGTIYFWFVSIVRKGVTRITIVGTLEDQETLVGTIVNNIYLLDIGQPNVGGFT